MKRIVNPLITWYQQNKRMLPWRIDKDPYHVWISEIMLQQTRIEAVKEYYYHFMKELPTIHDLAIIDEDKLLKLWEGLGYYTRARNLKKAAMMIESDYQGIFPNEYEFIKKLPGIGEYTAGAIGSICFSLKEVAIDGNVLRVMMRLLNSTDNIDENKTKENVKSILLEILPDNSGDFNEGIMELGETICLPNTLPKCDLCPLKEYCLSYQKGDPSLLPIRNEKKDKKIELLTVFILKYNDEIAIEKRKGKGLLHNLWQFPNVDGHKTKQEVKDFFSDCVISIEESISYQHIFTHKIWKIKTYMVGINKKVENYDWKKLVDIKEQCAIPTAFMPILKELEKESTG